jgi:hypothetical protein
MVRPPHQNGAAFGFREADCDEPGFESPAAVEDS